MTAVEEHVKKVKEHLSEIGGAIDEGIENKPATIGFHCSACSTQLLEIYLHKTNRISIGKTIKHNWFKRPSLNQKKDPLIERNLPTDFPDKQKIYDLIYDVEESRDNLVYGKTDVPQIKKVLDSFLKLKEIFVEKLKDEGVEIE